MSLRNRMTSQGLPCSPCLCGEFFWGLDGFDHRDDHLALTRAVEFDEHDTLPSTQQKQSTFNGQADRRSNHGGENVIGHVLGIVLVAIVELGDHQVEGVEHVEIGTGIEIGGGERSRSVEYQEIANSRCQRVIRLKQSFHGFGNVEDFAFLAGFEDDPLHENRGRNSSRVAGTGYHE